MAREAMKRTCVVRPEAFLAAQEALRLKRKRTLKNLRYEAKRRKLPFPDWNLLPFDVQLRVLACLEIKDLLRSCLFVCKQWKDAILSSQCFARHQYRQSQSLWATLWLRPYYDDKYDDNLDWGPYTILKLKFTEETPLSDQGIVCIEDEKCIRVGNPLKNNWKVIPPPSQEFSPICMKVDSSTSPASFKIVAEHWRKASVMHTEIFDSTTNTWNKGKSLTCDGYGSFQDQFETTLVRFSHSYKRIITYNFEHDRWSLKSYVSPIDNAITDRLILCKDEPILISYLGPLIQLSKEHSCCRGISEWSLITKLDIKAFLAQHNLKVQFEESAHCRAHCKGYVITFVVRLFGERTALLNYDMREGCWKLQGSMKGWPRDYDMEFTLSLIMI